jgi:hypothetical protein
MPRRLKGRILNSQRATRLVYLLTVHYLFHILEKDVDDLQGLCCSYPSLVLGESVYPLQNLLDVLLSKELLENFFCVVLSQVILYITEDGLTWLSLFNLFGRQRKGGE